MIYGIVYKLVDRQNPNNVLYVGSTEQTLLERWKMHVRDANNPKCKTKLYTYIRANGGPFCFEIIPIIKGKFTHRGAMRAREERLRLLHRAPLNMNRCSIGDMTEQEYRRMYYDEHREEQLEYAKTFYNKNRDKRRAQMKVYDTKNRDSIRAKRQEVVVCDCGLKRPKGSLSRHKTCKKHKQRVSIRKMVVQVLDELLNGLTIK